MNLTARATTSSKRAVQDLAARASFILCAVILSSCTTSPTISRKPDGTYLVNGGGTFMASRAGIVAEVKTAEGDSIKFLAKAEDSTKVPTNFLRTATAAFAGYFFAEAAAAQEVTAQVASKGATATTINASNNAAATEQAAIAADVTKATFVSP